MIGKRLTALAEAIRDYEGWKPDNLATETKNEATVAFRNNNPGNLRVSAFQIGVKDNFAYFYNEQVGYFALLYDLYKKAVGQSTSGLTPESNIKDLMLIYAPKTENDTEAYIKHIETKTGLKRTTKLKELLQE